MEKNPIIGNVAGLVKLKSILTLLLTITFCSMILLGQPLPPELVEIYKIVIVFFFGVQAGKKEV